MNGDPKVCPVTNTVVCPQLGTLAVMQTDLHDIKIALLGCDKLGVPGVIKTIDDDRKRIASLESTRTKAYGIAAGAGTVMGTFGAWILKVVGLQAKLSTP